MSDAINVIEIRRAKNGYVISAWFSDPFAYGRQQTATKGYETYICADDPAAVAQTVEAAIREHSITSDVPIMPARIMPAGGPQ